tara:strand:+ start:4122 stop:5513 length:1392 start_codon:yes stop_codon:yes gene_type:complete
MRLRFAPSPTGYLHVGGLRTALYNFFLAKQSKGKLILRIEDTDQNRLVQNAEENLINMLGWAGIDFDEGPHVSGGYGPYRQSERLTIYKEYYLKLIQIGHAYPCFYSKQRLQDLESGKLSSEDATIEDSVFQDFDLSNILQKMETESFVVRLKIPNNDFINFNDLIKGNIKFDLNLINDPIIIKSDGFPTYHFANVIDDHLMKITHVIRGEEWLPSIPKHIVLYQSLGWSPPEFGHLPLLLNSDKSKLSKRKNDVSVESYIKKGYTKESLINFLSLLGWHEKGDREFYNLNELIEAFSLDRVNKSGAIFDVQKLNAFNNHYIKNYKFDKLKHLLSPFIFEDWIITKDIIDLVKDKAFTLCDFKNLLSFIFIDSISHSDENIKILKSKVGSNILQSFLMNIKTINSLKEMSQLVQQDTDCSPKEFWSIIRIALSGESHGPALDMIINIYGLDKVKSRINDALKL